MFFFRFYLIWKWSWTFCLYLQSCCCKIHVSEIIDVHWCMKLRDWIVIIISNRKNWIDDFINGVGINVFRLWKRPGSVEMMKYYLFEILDLLSQRQKKKKYGWVLKKSSSLLSVLVVFYKGLTRELKLRRRYEKPTTKRHRLAYERSQRIYNNSMKEKVALLMRGHRDEYPWSWS